MKQGSIVALLAGVLVLPGSLVAQEDGGGAEAGNITGQLAPGMFLNPTAPGRAQGDLSAQYCISWQPVTGTANAEGMKTGKDTVAGHGGMAVYGLTDMIEVGGQFLIVGKDPDNMSESAGGQVRAQLLDGSDSFADISIGGVFLFNDIERQTVYGAASKTLDLSAVGGCPCDSVTLHVGARQFWLNVEGGSDVDDAVAFAGIELPVSETCHLIGEIQTEADADAHQPFSVGFQVRHPNGFACSLAAIQPGGTDGLGVFAGIGIPFN